MDSQEFELYKKKVDALMNLHIWATFILGGIVIYYVAKKL